MYTRRYLSLLLVAGLWGCATPVDDDASGSTDDQLQLGDVSDIESPLDGEDNDGAGDADEDELPDPSDRVPDAVEGASGSRLLKFGTVTSFISEYLESSFDIFFLANTANPGGADGLVPAQHIIMAERGSSGVPIFERNAQGKIVGFAPRTKLRTYKTSSGLGFTTFSGIFRVDEADSRAKHFTAPSAPMSHSIYIDHFYTDGRNSGVAIHGTPAKNHGLLGRARASHGCLRVHPDVAKELKQKLIFSGNYKKPVPKFDARKRLPSEAARNGQLGTEKGISALIVTFDGY